MWPLENPAPADLRRVPARPELVLVPRPARGARARRGRRIAIGLTVAVLLAANAGGVHHLQAVDRTARRLQAAEEQLQQRLASRRVDIAALERDIAATATELRARTAARDQLDAKAASAGAAAAAANAAVLATLKKAGAQRARLDALNDCLSILHKAMNALSVGDEGNGSTELRNLDSKCNELGR
jgi:chromosome segregation ATPase